jgi:hypothetical protein
MFELIFGLPVLLIVFFVTRKRDKTRPWFTIFSSQNDFLNNVLSVFAALCTGQVIWQLFDMLVLRNYSGTGSRWILELISLSIILVMFLVGYITKAYHTLAYSLLSLLFFYFYLLLSWSHPENGVAVMSILPVIAGTSVVFTLYIITKFLEQNQYYLRLVSYVQFFLIGLIYIGLAWFSSYSVSKADLLVGYLDFNNIPITLAVLLSVFSFIGVSLYSLGSKKINLFEFSAVLITGFLPIALIVSGAGNIYNGYSQADISLQSVLFNSISSLLFLLWPVFVVRRGSVEGVQWKRNYGLVLLILGIIAKIIELASAGLLQSGFVFVLVGASLVGAAIFLQLRKNKSNMV